MREIKFRAWDKSIKQWIPYFEISAIGMFVKCFKPNYIVPDAELMQYTGLKDKNGGEIYEGDIVRYRCLICVNKDLEQTYDEVIGVVEYQGSCFTAGMRQGYYSSYLLYELDKYEVIGNIYENPELLNEEKA